MIWVVSGVFSDKLWKIERKFSEKCWWKFWEFKKKFGYVVRELRITYNEQKKPLETLTGPNFTVISGKCEEISLQLLWVKAILKFS